MVQQAINRLLADGVVEVDEETPGAYHGAWE